MTRPLAEAQQERWKPICASVASGNLARRVVTLVVVAFCL